MDVVDTPREAVLAKLWTPRTTMSQEEIRNEILELAKHTTQNLPTTEWKNTYKTVSHNVEEMIFMRLFTDKNNLRAAINDIELVLRTMRKLMETNHGKVIDMNPRDITTQMLSERLIK